MRLEIIYKFEMSSEEVKTLKKFLGTFNEPDKQSRGLTEEQGHLLSGIWAALPDIED